MLEHIFLILITFAPPSDSNRVLRLHESGRNYLNQQFSPDRSHMMDTAVDIFNHAIRLSDSLHLDNLKTKSMLLAGIAYCVRGNLAQGEKLLYEVAAIYHNKGELNAEAETRIHLADYLYQASEYNLAEKELQLALAGSTNVAHVYFFLSMVSRYRGSYDKALSYALKCVETAKKTNELDSYYGELALVYDEIGRPEESSQWYRKTLEERIRQKTNPVVLFRTAGFLTRQLIKLKKARYALALMDSLVKVQPPHTSYEKGIAAQDYAYCFNALKRYNEAEQNFLAMIADLKTVQLDPETISITHMDVGRFYLQRGQFAQAHTYLDTAMVYKYDDRILDQKELLQMMFTTDSALGNYATAIKHLQQYQFLNDSIYNDRKSRQIEELTIQYETGKKEQSIRLLENERRLQQNELTKEQNTTRWIIGASALLLIIIGLLVNNTRLKQRINKQIEKKNNALQDLVAEKEWLVREIHHRVKNNFHIVMGLLGTQAAYLQGDEAIQALTESRRRIQAMSMVHQKLYQSDNLSAINMADYIHELIDYLKDSFPATQTIRFTMQIAPAKLNVSYCIPLGLILNEAITNAIKHAVANKIDVVLESYSPDRFLLSIKDNGIGMPADNITHRSMGMKLMKGLSDDLDAILQIKNEGGTEILLDFTYET